MSLPTMTDDAPPAQPATVPELAGRMADELARLEAELAEVDLLVTQAATEATRHESRRAAAAEKLTAAAAAAEATGGTIDPTVSAELNAQLVLVTKRSALMESQVEVLEGKRRALRRYRDALAGYVEALQALGDGPAARARPRRRAVAPTPATRWHRPCRACCSMPRRTCAARSPARCTTDRPRA